MTAAIPEDDGPRPAPSRAGRFGLSARLLVLTLLFGLLAEALLFGPLIAGYRVTWLGKRVAGAATAALVMEAVPEAPVSGDLALRILGSIGARMVALETKDGRRVLARTDMPSHIDVETDLRTIGSFAAVAQAFDTLTAAEGRVLRITGPDPAEGRAIELVMDEAALREAMHRFSATLLVVTLLILSITGGLLYLTLSWLIVRPVRRLAQAMLAFAEDPENPSRLLSPSSRGDEIGLAQREFAAMQHRLLAALRHRSRLASLGLAVSKINHDLRNILAAAQLFSDRLATSHDPMVQRFVPKLVETLDRAIAFCQATLSYGQAAEPPPARAMVPLAPLLAEVRDSLGPAADAVRWTLDVPPELAVDADAGQLARVLVNLLRNAVEAARQRPAEEEMPPAVHVTARRLGALVGMEIADNGPGVPARAREKLFEAFAAAARGGAGLGLAIAAELVRGHGGTLALVGGPPGAVFRIEIPDRDAA